MNRNLTEARFMIVDDDPINNMICTKVINSVFVNAEVKAFTNPKEGLAFLETARKKKDKKTTILFLDINMPVITGWEFMDLFESMNSTIKGKMAIYILSSSINPNDKEKAKGYRNILDYIVKPLSQEVVLSVALRYSGS